MCLKKGKKKNIVFRKVINASNCQQEVLFFLVFRSYHFTSPPRIVAQIETTIIFTVKLESRPFSCCVFNISMLTLASRRPLQHKVVTFPHVERNRRMKLFLTPQMELNITLFFGGFFFFASS